MYGMNTGLHHFVNQNWEWDDQVSLPLSTDVYPLDNNRELEEMLQIPAENYLICNVQ